MTEQIDCGLWSGERTPRDDGWHVCRQTSFNPNNPTWYAELWENRRLVSRAKCRNRKAAKLYCDTGGQSDPMMRARPVPRDDMFAEEA